jgi:hypothetical protein
VTEREKELLGMAGDLAEELARAHGNLFCLIWDLRNTELSEKQEALINIAETKLCQSQGKFLRKYAEDIGGGAPERN